MNGRPLLLSSFLLALMFSLSSCSSLLEDTGKLFVKLGKPDEGPSTVDLMVYADENVNINRLNEPTPVSFVVVQMKNDLRLYSSTFAELSGDIKAVLKNDYVNHGEFMVEPGKFTHIGPFELEKQTNFIAVISAYRDMEQVIWRASDKVDSEKKKYSAHVLLKQGGVKMDVQE
jgi:type VI secretion system protein VasD